MNKTLSYLSLNEWKQEVRSRDYLRRKSALADFLTTPEQSQQIRRGSAAVPRMYRAHSQQGSERLELPTIPSQGRMTRAYSHEGEVPVVLQPLMSPHGRVKKLPI